eukprot:GHVT01009503.1.p1 GENE.GHVT01009503.1~~GHVT01009503.1.p1  ORF type:complete len:138 (+),score=11.46 GHVT01009503.1:526-939(+)
MRARRLRVDRQLNLLPKKAKGESKEKWGGKNLQHHYGNIRGYPIRSLNPQLPRKVEDSLAKSASTSLLASRPHLASGTGWRVLRNEEFAHAVHSLPQSSHPSPIFKHESSAFKKKNAGFSQKSSFYLVLFLLKTRYL